MDVHPFLADGLTRVAALLEELKIPFCVAGGWAVGMWAAPRATEDINLLVLLEAGDRERVAEALIACGHPLDRNYLATAAQGLGVALPERLLA